MLMDLFKPLAEPDIFLFESCQKKCFFVLFWSNLNPQNNMITFSLFIGLFVLSLFEYILLHDYSREYCCFITNFYLEL